MKKNIDLPRPLAAAVPQPLSPNTFDKPLSLVLEQNEPNPFRGKTTIRFYVPRPERVTLRLVSASDRKQVGILYQGEIEAGWHCISWKAKMADGSPVAAGRYLYRLEGEGFVAIRTLEIKE
ncbi:MAG: hypothetical protein AAF840_05660 [Bacteroidota bacterium]